MAEKFGSREGKNPPIFIVEKHHEALRVWARIRSTLNRSPRLLSLDHHTDTSLPFRNYIRTNYNVSSQEAEKLRDSWLAQIDFTDSNSISLAMGRLSNDEHIVTALGADIISNAMVIAHNAYDTDQEVYAQHGIICYAADRKPQSVELIKSDCDQVLESEFLEGGLRHFDGILKQARQSPLAEIPYILDIDLDYINTLKALTPDNHDTLERLAQNALAITIATEPEYVKSCALDTELNSSIILEHILRLFQSFGIQPGDSPCPISC